MALYKDGDFLRHNTGTAFDAIHAAGISAPNPGIYRCPGCGHEIAIALGHTLPPQNHHQHTIAQGKVRWQLIVSHQSYAKN
jgi:hypothetical protein